MASEKGPESAPLMGRWGRGLDRFDDEEEEWEDVLVQGSEYRETGAQPALMRGKGKNAVDQRKDGNNTITASTTAAAVVGGGGCAKEKGSGAGRKRGETTRRARMGIGGGDRLSRIGSWFGMDGPTQRKYQGTNIYDIASDSSSSSDDVGDDCGLLSEGAEGAARTETLNSHTPLLGGSNTISSSSSRMNESTFISNDGSSVGRLARAPLTDKELKLRRRQRKLKSLPTFRPYFIWLVCLMQV